MINIVSHVDIELDAKIQYKYNIEGIPDKPMTKIILYSVQIISNLRKRSLYEAK
jgi:hypothetical protein